jgi:hypothetical protein
VCVRVLVSSTAQRAENACVCVSRFVCARAYVCGVCVCARALMCVLVRERERVFVCLRNAVLARETVAGELVLGQV